MSTNSPERPRYDGQISVFQSPHHHSVMLVDVACRDKYGALSWNAVPHETQLYAASVAQYKKDKSLAGRLHHFFELSF